MQEHVALARPTDDQPVAGHRHAPVRTVGGLYFDLVEYEAYGLKNQTPNTPAISLLYALDAQLGFIMQEGISARWARHAAMAIQTYG